MKYYYYHVLTRVKIIKENEVIDPEFLYSLNVVADNEEDAIKFLKEHLKSYYKEFPVIVSLSKTSIYKHELQPGTVFGGDTEFWEPGRACNDV